MKHTYDRASGLSSNIRQALQVATTDNETLFRIIMDTFQERDRLIDTLDEVHKERASDRKALIEALGYLDHHLPLSGLIARVSELHQEREYYRIERNTLRQGLVALTEAVTGEPAENDFLSPDVLTTLISELRASRDKAVKTLTLAGYTDNGGLLWKPKLGETPERFKPRYIVHGHVQPCVVLYSDETTTLVFAQDGGDMMCETDTIQWSDALTYRCQELLASAGLERGSMAAQRVLPVLSELVRDERVTLNDEGVAVEQPEFVAPIA